MKKYKMATPLQTIRQIRNTLDNIGIILNDRHMLHKHFNSCRVIIGNDGLSPLNIGTNGKGRNFEYSLASGYAEFMERIQNRLLLHAQKMLTDKTFNLFAVSDESQKKNQYLYDPDEHYIDFNELPSEFLDDFRKMCGFNSIDDLKDNITKYASNTKPLVIPFYDVNNQKEIELPIEFLLLLTGSNGMASGNTPKEAILQALCEIFERYVISEIYWKELTPPTIPLSAFEGTTIYQTITQYIEETGNTVIIKDCSLSIGLPAVGLIIINNKELIYNFKLGVDFVPSIALERCFTEIHQGRDSFQGLPFEFIKTKGQNEVARKEAERNLMKIFINGTGYWPMSILKQDFSYEFKGFNMLLGESNSYDLSYSIKLIKELGYNMYIRDNSILGFPTYLVVIPGMSQIIKTNPFVSIYKNSFVDFSLANKMGSINKEMATKIFNAIDENYEMLKKEDFQINKVFVYNTNKDLNDLTIEMLASLLSLYIGNDNNAIKYLELYLKDKDKKAYAYYYACLDYLRFANTSNTQDNLLTLLYGQDLANEVINDISDRNHIFQYYNLPNCPHCDNCKLAGECKQRIVDGINQRINNQSLHIDQIDIKQEIEDEKE